MKVQKFLLVLILILFILLPTVAMRPLQEAGGTTWQDVFKAVIMLTIAIAGSPITQLLKIALKIEDRLALLLTGIVAAGIAVLEMWLSGLLDFRLVTIDSFPATFFAVFSVATVYYQLLKGTENIFGKKLLLKPLAVTKKPNPSWPKGVTKEPPENL
jgi:hypothetical protein